MKKAEAVAAVMHNAAADAVNGSIANGLVVGAGNNSQALAIALPNAVNVLGTTSATASTGGILSGQTDIGDSIVVANIGANTALVYPPVGGKIGTAATNAGFSLATNKTATFTRVSDLQWIAQLSA